jgi:hypothetical protein
MPHHFLEEQAMRAAVLGLMAGMLISSSATSVTLKEASSTFESAQVAPFMARVSKLIDSGFGPAESEGIVQLITSMKADDESVRDFTVKYAGRETLLRIQIVIGPRESARLAFFTSPELADRIQRERNIFLDESDR